MPAEKSHARLGLFLVVVFVVMLATSLLFVQRMRSRHVIDIVTYTDGDVSGLDIASPVRYRGVAVGRVTDVGVDPLGDIVEIDFELFVDRLNTIGINAERIRRFADLGGVFPRLRAQVVGNPVTGEAYLLLSVPKSPPPPLPLKFTPTKPYVPSMPTTLASIQDRLPEVLGHVETTLQTLRTIVERIPDSLDRSDRFFSNVETMIRQSDLPALSADSRKFFAATSAQLAQVTSELEAVVGKEGTLTRFAEEARAALKASDLPATNQSARAAADRTAMAADDLRRALPAIRGSLEQLRELARQLDEQPESVVYGPRPKR